MEKNTYTIISTQLGLLGAFRTPFGLKKLTLPKSSYDQVLAEIDCYIAGADEDSYSFPDISYQLQRYFEGKRIGFNVELDLRGSTEFEQSVWKLTRTIPFGETRSYSWIAQQIGCPKAARAVGNALSRNRLPIVIPCHRVINENGGIGGFSGGLKMKKRLLQLEGLEL